MKAKTSETYQIGHEALGGKISLAGLRNAIRKYPANRTEILIAAATEALETSRNELALQMLKVAAAALDSAQPRERS
jgi:hypothetical protein